MLYRLLRCCLWVVIWAAVPVAQAAPVSFQPEDDPQASVVWQRLRQSLFGERPIQAATPQLLSLKVPPRALESAFVPVQVIAGPASGSVHTLYLIADANPSPLAAKVQFQLLGMPIHLETRIRIDAFTHIRVVAETTDGQLFMATRFTKATGGCTAPATIDVQAALQRLGGMHFNIDHQAQAQRVRWRMDHPNHSGLVMDQLSRLNIPAHYVQQIQVRLNDHPVLLADVDFSLSENPSLQFSLPGHPEGVLQVQVQDSQGLRFQGQQSLGPAQVQAVAPGVYAVLGDAQQQQGNAGFIVGPQGVMVIDSGHSWRQGQALLDTVRSITPLPIQLLLLTHARGEFIFGAGPFQAQGIPVHMHQDAARLVQARCATCLQQLQQRFGAEAMAGTALPHADVLLTHSTRMQHTGRQVQVLAAGHSSSPGALAVLDEQSGAIFAGSWLDVQHIPDLRDAQVTPWLNALVPWLKDDERLWIPGHGPVASGHQAQQLLDYLQPLQSCVQQHVAQGTSLIDMDKACPQPAFAQWAFYDSQHPRNVVRLYLQTEREALFSTDMANP